MCMDSINSFDFASLTSGESHIFDEISNIASYI